MPDVDPEKLTLSAKARGFDALVESEWVQEEFHGYRVRIRYPAFAAACVLREGDVVETTEGTVGLVVRVHETADCVRVQELRVGLRLRVKGRDVMTKHQLAERRKTTSRRE